MAPMSSATASVSRNTLAAMGTRLPTSVTTPTAKAMSVAIGTPQPSLPAPPALTAGVDRGGHDHAAERGDDRQGHRPEVAQPAVHDLALDLDADEQEEHRHQGVVDPGLQREVVEVQQVAELDAQRRRPQVEVRSPATASSPRRWR